MPFLTILQVSNICCDCNACFCKHTTNTQLEQHYSLSSFIHILLFWCNTHSNTVFRDVILFNTKTIALCIKDCIESKWLCYLNQTNNSEIGNQHSLTIKRLEDTVCRTVQEFFELSPLKPTIHKNLRAIVEQIEVIVDLPKYNKVNQLLSLINS